VHWKEPFSPALPWDNATANKFNHNHLTGQHISRFEKWEINKAWDNRTLHSENLGDEIWAHGMILPGNAVRYGWADDVPEAARDAVEAGFDDWIAKARSQFEAHDEAWDRLAIDFDRANSGDKEITVDFVETLSGAHADFDSATKVISVVASPMVKLQTASESKWIRMGDGGTGARSIELVTPWSYDGSPASTAVDFDYSTDGGATWTDAPPGGFGDLTWCAATCGNTIAPADTLNIFEMDFRTVVFHEIGHAIALGHTGHGSGPIMRDDVADRASFGNTMGIDVDSALGVAIAYTYSVPEPGGAVPLLLAGMNLAVSRRRAVAS
jgi:hypothetical protein